MNIKHLVSASELETLQKLAKASSECFTLALHDAYKALPQADIASLQKKKLWFVASASQGNLTEAGAEVLKDAREMAAHKAVRDALLLEAKRYSYTLLETQQTPGCHPKDEFFRLTKVGFGSIDIQGTAQFALFLLEERLCQEGKL